MDRCQYRQMLVALGKRHSGNSLLCEVVQSYVKCKRMEDWGLNEPFELCEEFRERRL